MIARPVTMHFADRGKHGHGSPCTITSDSEAHFYVRTENSPPKFHP